VITSIDELRGKATLYAIVLIWATVPVLAVLSFALGDDGLIAAGLMAVLAVLVTLEMRRNKSGLSTQMAASAALAVAVSSIVYLMRGNEWQPDMHMIFFAAFALTAVFCDWRPIVTYATVIAVHHLVLNFALTEAVFPGEASLGRVMLHAVVLVVQAVPLIWLATVLERLFTHSTGLLQSADQARRDAEENSNSEGRGRQEMSGIVQTVEYVMGQLAAGDLSIKLEPEDLPERYQALGTSFNATVKALSLVILDVEKGAQGLLVSAEALAESARVGADRAKQQSESVEESAAAMNQLTSGVEATTALASEADAMMTANQKEAEIGGSVLEQAVAAMQRIEESSNQISRISAVMEDIAFQTNLLALNAGVEAARAGELGRGFAVVASEVRELSQRAGDATKEIRTLVSDSRKNVAKGAELVGKTSESLGALIKGAGKTAVIVSDIATKMREQTRGLGALSNNIMVLEMTAQAGTQVANQSSAMGHQLREQASAMIGSVTAFRSGQVGGVHSAAIAAE
jgi:methyl-accepting chemotaxis protein